MSAGLRVLIVEDDATLAANLGDYLEERGHEPDFASDGRVGLALAISQPYDALILDLRLPVLDGVSVCRRLRAQCQVCPAILMLTARDTLDDRIEGLEAGADDYLVKPFSLREMNLRLQAIVRRHRPVTLTPLVIGELELKPQERCVYYRQRIIDLSPIGFVMLETLMSAYPALVSRADFETRIWDDEPPNSDAALRGHVHRLRETLAACIGTDVIQTVHGMGYRLLDIS